MGSCGIQYRDIQQRIIRQNAPALPACIPRLQKSRTDVTLRCASSFRSCHVSCFCQLFRTEQIPFRFKCVLPALGIRAECWAAPTHPYGQTCLQCLPFSSDQAQCETYFRPCGQSFVFERQTPSSSSFIDSSVVGGRSGSASTQTRAAGFGEHDRCHSATDQRSYAAVQEIRVYQ